MLMELCKHTLEAESHCKLTLQCAVSIPHVILYSMIYHSSFSPSFIGLYGGFKIFTCNTAVIV